MRSGAALAFVLLALAAAASAQQPVAEAGAAPQQACQPLPTPATPAGGWTADKGVTDPRLLDTLVKEVDESGVFNDSKTIVDMPLKAPVAEVAAAFDALQLPEDPQQRNQTLFDFVQQWLSLAGTELIPSTTNFTAQPPPAWFDTLTDPEIRGWAHELYAIWGRLTRQLDPAVAQNPELYTMLPVPNPFVIPGARFREIYYWDSFWVLEGLLSSGLTTLAEDIINNFIHLMAEYGHIPNGIRAYYLNRSQPPLFSQMVKIVYNATGNRDMLSQAMPALLAEHAYWTSPSKQFTAPGPDGTPFTATRYYADWDQPRPESYTEDVETAREAGLNPDMPDDRTRQLWRDIASAAESGWDFSTRWFADGQNLTTIRTTHILPADLNAFLMQMEDNIADFAAELACEPQLEQSFRQLADDRRTALNTLFWNGQTAQWHDLVCIPTPYPAAAAPAAGAALPQQLECQLEQNPAVFASNWVPLWAGAVPPGSQQALAAVDALAASGLYRVGGVAMSLTDSGQQWDFSNVWPPVDWMLIDGASRFGGEPGATQAAAMAASLLSSAFATWRETGRMYEKFNATQVGLPGGGGEYEVVDGFGWTNGACLNLLERFGWQ